MAMSDRLVKEAVALEKHTRALHAPHNAQPAPEAVFRDLNQYDVLQRFAPGAADTAEATIAQTELLMGKLVRTAFRRFKRMQCVCFVFYLVQLRGADEEAEPREMYWAVPNTLLRSREDITHYLAVLPARLETESHRFTDGGKTQLLPSSGVVFVRGVRVECTFTRNVGQAGGVLSFLAPLPILGSQRGLQSALVNMAQTASLKNRCAEVAVRVVLAYAQNLQPKEVRVPTPYFALTDVQLLGRAINWTALRQTDEDGAYGLVSPEQLGEFAEVNTLSVCVWQYTHEDEEESDAEDEDDDGLDGLDDAVFAFKARPQYAITHEYKHGDTTVHVALHGGHYWPVKNVSSMVGAGRNGRNDVCLRCGMSFKKVQPVYKVVDGVRTATKRANDKKLDDGRAVSNAYYQHVQAGCSGHVRVLPEPGTLYEFRKYELAQLERSRAHLVIDVSSATVPDAREREDDTMWVQHVLRSIDSALCFPSAPADAQVRSHASAAALLAYMREIAPAIVRLNDVNNPMAWTAAEQCAWRAATRCYGCGKAFPSAAAVSAAKARKLAGVATSEDAVTLLRAICNDHGHLEPRGAPRPVPADLVGQAGYAPGACCDECNLNIRASKAVTGFVRGDVAVFLDALVRSAGPDDKISAPRPGPGGQFRTFGISVKSGVLLGQLASRIKAGVPKADDAKEVYQRFTFVALGDVLPVTWDKAVETAPRVLRAVSDCAVAAAADVLEWQAAKLFGTFGLDILQHCSAPSYADSLARRSFRTQGVTVELLSDAQHVDMVQQAKVGGLASLSLRHFKANTPVAPWYDPSSLQTGSVSIDAVGCYGAAAEQPVPVGNYRLVDGAGPIAPGLVDVTAHYPEDVHRRLDALPPAPHKVKVEGSMLHPYQTVINTRVPTAPISAATLLPRRQTLHWKELQFAIAKGLVVDEVHRRLLWDEAPVLRPLMQKLNAMRIMASRAGDKTSQEVAKTFVVSLLGRCIMDTSKFARYFCTTSADDDKRLRRHSRPGFLGRTLWAGNNAYSLVQPQSYKVDTPVAIGVSIYALARCGVFGMHYRVQDAFAGRALLVYHATDSLKYLVRAPDGVQTNWDAAEEFMRKPQLRPFLDLSTLPLTHPLYDDSNHKRHGFFRLEDGPGQARTIAWAATRPLAYTVLQAGGAHATKLSGCSDAQRVSFELMESMVLRPSDVVVTLPCERAHVVAGKDHDEAAAYTVESQRNVLSYNGYASRQIGKDADAIAQFGLEDDDGVTTFALGSKHT